MAEKAREYPELRFQGFSGAWEKRKLSDISEKVTQKNTNNSFSEVFTNSAERGIISQLDFFDKDIANQKNISGYFIVKNDDFVYNPRISNLAPVGPIKRNKLGRNGVMSSLYYIFRTHSISPSFLEYYFEGTQWHYFMYLNGDTGARADRFAIKDSVFSTMPIFITSSSEQIQIGSFFKSLDELITVNQRKLNELKKLKKAYLQKMFPKNGVSIPELRFAGFTTPWEKRKLGDVSDIQGGGTPDSKNQAYWSGDINWFTPTEVFNQGYLSESRRKITKEGLLKSSATLMPPGTVLMTSRAGVGDMGILTQAAATNQGFQSMIPHKEMPSYLLYSMQFFISRMANKLASGSTFMEISGKQLAKIEVMIPGDSQERELLCNFFKNLDDMITVNQRKLDKLKELKKGYLQKMFI
ncbi:type I restriction endonuclease subunit S [Oenococcus oeni]|uniref:restriction endonuclease subunit S n=3 Tax=Oenococcus oeni TaxID=1247 RepID=UPI00050F1029|nr:restriction endonuclease subunit S [Oenococcus oeni]KGH76596.1 type I restriction modification protein subunit S [Oenococcus oeni IOEB_9803]KGH79028.1 type I restriction modification protein subunit S [Oenococcus oeni IOEB_8417]OIL36714.1 type I restriction endonuclease subunit S [Oenococcus oeni]OIL49486.1 type I restriction endonuclease subunit S [Oenococcus oeni]OIL55179.1 type I restriction endonuclease subunit S [Oenococcus oeni]